MGLHLKLLPMSMLRTTLFRSVTSVILLVGLYVLSIGPTARWVALSLRRSQTLSSFNNYDARLARYYAVYRPIHWICCYDRSYIATRAIWSYENLWIPRFTPPNLSLPVESFVIWPPVFGLRPEVCSTTTVDLLPVLRQQGIQFSSGGYAYYLPRTWTLIVHGTQEDIDLACVLCSDYSRRDGPLELSYAPPLK